MIMESNKIIKNSLIASLLILSTGCTHYKAQTRNYYSPRNDGNDEIRQKALESKFYDFIPRHRTQIKWYDLPHWIPWALMGNDNNGIFGEDKGSLPYRKDISVKTFCSWTARNPLHNISFYVPPLGTTGLKKHQSFSLIRCDENGLKILTTKKGYVFLKGNNTFQISVYDFKPFISFKFCYSKSRQCDFYVGGRPEGAFGFKFRPVKKRK